MGLISGPCSDKLLEQLQASISEGIDSAVKSQRVAKFMMGKEQYSKMKERVSKLLQDDIKVYIQHVTPYLDEAFNVRKTLETSMCALTSEEFADMLRPAFEQGEWQLILIGALLGLIVG